MLVSLTCLQAFQLTPSRRATAVRFSFSAISVISTHALTEGDLQIGPAVAMASNISTHALTEGDQAEHLERARLVHFNSRPHGGRRSRGQSNQPGAGISTHALTEGDVVISVSCLLTWNFNSRPHGGRRIQSMHIFETMYFNSRPHGGRQAVGHLLGIDALISTHALTEGDLNSCFVVLT